MSLTSAVAPLITPVGIASLLTPDMIATSGTTVTLAAIATDADREECAAFGGTTNSQANEDFVLDRSAHCGIMPARMTGRMTRACGADDVAVRLMSTNLRFLMIAYRDGPMLAVPTRLMDILTSNNIQPA